MMSIYVYRYQEWGQILRIGNFATPQKISIREIREMFIPSILIGIVGGTLIGVEVLVNEGKELVKISGG